MALIIPFVVTLPGIANAEDRSVMEQSAKERSCGVNLRSFLASPNTLHV
jgi:hypothetical protein